MADDDNRKLTGLLKKAVEIGAGAYVSAEDKVQKTLNSVQIPKEFLKEAIESVIKSYTIQITAEVKLVPKTNKETPKEEESAT